MEKLITQTLKNKIVFIIFILVIFGLGMFLEYVLMDKKTENKENDRRQWMQQYFKNMINIISEDLLVYIVLFITFLIGISITVMCCSDKPVDSNIISTILNFYISFIFAWLLTKKSSEAEFKRRQKESAIRSYRHIGKIKDQATYSISQVGDMIGDNLKNDQSVELNAALVRIRDALVYIRGGIEVSIDDWGDLIDDVIQKRESEKAKELKKDVDKKVKEIFQSK
ncbi:hypothetical protein [Anaerophilus nitritogenes]|uniref:hypothetical protein n=1 Tax=Anaerophilus nitritogenes TaxID=2498136 RepID=UPI00101C2250|nr:hypothetical protein [Anaerophilus nitritogenes]